MSAGELPESPFQGLEPFTEDDRAYFFGREEDQQTIGANLVISQLTVFYGASGVGKTSVLMAGVIPFVRSQPDVAVVLYRNWQDPDAFRALNVAIIAAAGAKDVDVNQPLDKCLAEVYRQTRKTLTVILDQFEEYMLYNPAESERGRRFDAEFARAVNREDVDANFLISIREDALARLDRFQPYIPDVLGNYLRLDHLDAAGARRAVEKPLAHYNEVAAAIGKPGSRMEIEPELVAGVLDEVRIGRVSAGGAAGKGRVTDSARIETPFLQMVLMKVWRVERAAGSAVMRAATLKQLGGAQKIVSDHVDSVMGSLTPAQRDAACAIFDRLVTPSGSKIAYSGEDLRKFAGSRGEAVPSLLERLSDRHVRILRGVAPLGDSPEVRYEIFHDVLSGAVLAWRTRYLRALEVARDREKWIRRMIVAALVVLLVGGGWYFYEKKQNETRLQIAVLQRQIALNTLDASSSRAGLLRQSIALSTRIDDKESEATSLAQLGHLYVEEQKYGEAVADYDKAIAATTNEKTKTDLQAFRYEALGGMYRTKDPGTAANYYDKAAVLYARSGRQVEAAHALTSAASAKEDAGDLEGALSRWQRAHELQRKLKDADGNATSVKAIARLTDLLAKKNPKLTSGLDTLVLTTSTAAPTLRQPWCMEALPGIWQQIDATAKGGSFVWKFTVKGEGVYTALHMERVDGAVSGDFALINLDYMADLDVDFEGTLRWANGDERRITLPLPDKNNCKRINSGALGVFTRVEASGK